MSLSEVSIPAEGGQEWSMESAIERIANLQGKKVDLAGVGITPHHLHFGDFGDLSQRPIELRPHIEKALFDSQAADAKLALAEEYDRYIDSLGVPGQSMVRGMRANYAEDIYPDAGLGNLEAIAKNFRMADFLIQFQMREDVKALIPNYYHPTTPGFFINGTRVEGEGSFLIDLETSNGSIRTHEELREFVYTCIPWHRDYESLGISNKIDAYYLPQEHRAVVSALEASVIV